MWAGPVCTLMTLTAHPVLPTITAERWVPIGSPQKPHFPSLTPPHKVSCSLSTGSAVSSATPTSGMLLICTPILLDRACSPYIQVEEILCVVINPICLC